VAIDTKSSSSVRHAWRKVTAIAPTERERQIMKLVVSGRVNKQIAAELSLSEMTVKVHRGQVMRKMKAGSLPELVRMADRLDATGIAP
jgi:FixJ family two-component response regulator